MPASPSRDRTLDLLIAAAADGGARPIAAVAAGLGLPRSTAYRMIARMHAHGLLARLARGRFAGGATLALLGGGDPRAVAAAVARPLLQGLVRQLGRTAHLGVLDSDMVTYLVKESPAGRKTFTREAMQQEAYCSALGKILLSALPPAAQEAYLAQGGFVALTPATLTTPARLRQELATVRARGFAVDQEEVAPGLFCLAVPVPTVTSLPPMALSLAGSKLAPRQAGPVLAALRSAATAMASQLGGLPTLGQSFRETLTSLII